MDFAELFDFNSPIYEPQLLEFSELGDLAPSVADESEYFVDPPAPGRVIRPCLWPRLIILLSRQMKLSRALPLP